MKNTITAGALDSAITHALLEAGADDGDCGDTCTRTILSAFVEHTERLQNDDSNWWQAMLAIVDPFIELTAAVMGNPLGDNSDAVKTALKSMKQGIERELEARARETENREEVGMNNTIDADALGEAIARALSTQVDGYDCDTAMIVGGIVERATKRSKSLEGWFFPVSAVVSPLLELTAAVIENPLGDNTKAAEAAVRWISENVRKAGKDYIKDFKEPKTRKNSAGA